MTSGWQATLRRHARRTIRWLGVDLVRYDAAHNVDLRRAQLLHDREIDVVLDVGANDGPFGRQLRDAGYRGRIVSFEPQSTAFAALEHTAAADELWSARRVAVGAEDGEATLHLAENSSSSSLLGMTQRHVASAPESRYVGQELVEVRTLDSLRQGLVAEDERVYLKVDVQGAELDVLRGGEHVLGQTEVVEAELSLVSLYEGAPRFDEVIEHLAARGFGVLALDPVFVDPADGQLLQVDAVFGRSRRT